MTKRLKITFGKNGSVKSEVTGVKGPACKEISSFLDVVFGEPDNVELKDSYNEIEETETTFIVDDLPSGHCG